RLRGRSFPDRRALGHCQSPIEQIADMRQDRDRCSTAVTHASFRETILVRGHRLAAAISERGDGITEEFTLGVHGSCSCRFGRTKDELRIGFTHFYQPVAPAPGLDTLF